MTRSAPRLILASASERRRDLLAQIGITPDRIVAATIDEAPRPRELPRDLAAGLAAEKAAAAAADHPGAYILAADTVVACGRRSLAKAATADEARRFLRLLSGRRHRVHTGVALVDPEGRMHSRLVTTMVQFKRLADDEIEAYVAGGEWRGKAGAYAIQGRAGAFVRRVNGSFSAVVGLPLCETADLLAGAGWRAS